MAAILPTFFLLFADDGYAYFAIFFCVMAVAALVYVWPQFPAADKFESKTNSFLSLLSAAKDLQLESYWYLLWSIKSCRSSSLFLFFVESRLNAPDWAGIFLILFFLAAAIATPFWTKLADVHGVFNILRVSMACPFFHFLGPHSCRREIS